MLRRLPFVLKAVPYVLIAAAPSLVFAQPAPRATFTVTRSADLNVTEAAGAIAADFNADGHLDLIVTSRGAFVSNIKFLVGDGSGSLTHAAPFSFMEASAAAAADFDGDGFLDVAVTQDVLTKGFGYGDAICGSLVGIALFRGPTMSSPRCIATVPRPIAIQSGDFDGDDRPDLAVVSASGQGLLIYTNLDFVTHTVTITAVAGGNVQATSMARPVDLDGDGTLDLVIGHGAGVNAYLGNGDGTFRGGGSAGASGRRAVATGDINDDQVPDVVSVDSSSGQLFVAFGAGDGTFASRSIATIGPDLSDLAIADVDRDAHADVIVVHRGAGAIRTLLGNGDGTFVDQVPLAIGSRPKFVAVHDWDEDGDLDVEVVDTGVNGANALAWIARQDGRGPDVKPPSLSVPSNAALQADGPAGSVFIYTASAFDDIDGPLSASCSPASGSLFPIGVTTVSCSATDSAGNTASASFTVTVVRPSIVMTSVTASPPAPVQYGMPVTWTAGAIGGFAPLEYQFWRYTYGSRTWTLARSYSTDASFSWTPGPGDTGAYAVQVWVRSNGSSAPYEAYRGTGVYTVTSGPPARLTSLTASASAVPYGTPLTWTAAAVGGTGPLQYEFWRYSSAKQSWVIGQAYGPSPSYTWTPAVSDIGPCAVHAWVRTAGAAVPFESALTSAVVLVTSTAPITVSSIVATPGSPAPVGTTISWTVTATGGSGPLEYQFWRYSYASASWTLARDYATEASSTWTTRAGDEGTYAWQVWVRSVGTSAAYEAYRGTGPYVVSSPTP